MPIIAPDSTVIDSLLRYRFDDTEQLRSHVHSLGASLVFFYPTRALRLDEGSPVAIELTIASTDQRFTLHGSVGKASEQPGGFWLEFREPTPIAGILAAVTHPKRRGQRIATNLPVLVSRERKASTEARLLDLSSASGRLSGAAGIAVGDNLWLRVRSAASGLLDDLGPARVTWTRGGEAGVKFIGGALGRSAMMGLIRRMQSLWAAAPVVDHATLCRCSFTGGVAEPRLPFPAVR
jgi:hypothetical protein